MMKNDPPSENASASHGSPGDVDRSRAQGVSFRSTFAALKHRNYRLFFMGQLVSLIGSWMQNTAQGWLVYQLTGSKILLGTVAAAGSLPMLLFSVWEVGRCGRVQPGPALPRPTRGSAGFRPPRQA
jgi:hypothetical protein